MNNVSHGVAVLKDGKGKGEGRKRKLELDTHRITKAAIYGRARSTGEGKALRERKPVVKERMRRKMNISRSIDFAYISKIGISIITTS